MSDDFKGRGGSPWGAPPGGGGNGSGRGPTPPDIDAIIKDIQNKINKFLPGGSKSGGKPIGLILIVLLFVWLASGLYRVLPDEQGVVLRFGKFIKTTQPGLNYHIPFPVETVETPKVTKVNRMDIGVCFSSDLALYAPDHFAPPKLTAYSLQLIAFVKSHFSDEERSFTHAPAFYYKWWMESPV